MTSPPRAAGETGRELGGRYRLVAPIGVGTSSRVYLAADERLRRRVAVKLVHQALAADPAFLARFRAEARAAAALNHPNIVAVHDWGEDDTPEGPVPYLVTEYLAGGSLRDLLDSGHRLTPSQALLVGLDATRALAHAHRRGLVHRDVKPANLLFDGEGRLRLADFGLARAVAEASWTEPAGATLGTARYASPEQALGRRVDGRSDIYSLALVLVEAVTGVVPFAADTTAATLAARARGDLDPGDGFGALRGPLERAGRLEPAERPDADEFEIALLATAEAMPRPDPLPLSPPTGTAEATAELRALGVTPFDGPVPPGRDADGTSVPEGEGEAVVPGDGPVPDGPETPDPREATGPLERTPIVVAEEHHLLTSSRPAEFGPVEPLPPRPAPAPTPADPAGPPSGRRRVAVVVALGLVAAGLAAAWWFLVRVPTHEVPDLVGGQVAAARVEARANGWRVDASDLVRRDGTRPDEVVAQRPRAGSELAEGDTLRLTVSLGPTLVVPPAVEGRPEAEARRTLTESGFTVGDVTPTDDEQVPEGSVVRLGPAAGAPAPDPSGRLPRGTTLDLVVSAGPAPRVVPPGLSGARLSDARATLSSLQLQVSVTEQYDDTLPAGYVVSSSPAGGTQVERGSTVALVVSRGRAPVPVPDVRGRSGTSAAAALEAAGLAVAGIEGPPSGAVLATDPPAGEAVPPGTAVRVFTRT